MQEGGKPAEAYGFCSEVRKILKVLGLGDLHRAGFYDSLAAVCVTLDRLDPGSWIGRSRRASPNRVIRTIQRPLTSTTVTSPRSFASSQTGSLGHDVRQAEMTSS